MIDIESRAQAAYDSLMQQDYNQAINRISAAVKTDLWLIGGWIRSHLLGVANIYAGDIDLLVEMPNSELHARMTTACIPFQPNAWGGARIPLPDGNHIDIGSVANFGANNISEAMQNADFSVNAVAISLKTKKIECGLSENEMKSGYFSARKRTNRDDFGAETCKAAIAFRSYFGLHPSNDPITTALLNEVAQRHANCYINDHIFKELLKIIPDNEAWIVRGFARCTCMKQLEFWDDIDIAVIGCKSDLTKTIADSGYRYSLTIFGNPKLLLSDERTADIWCVHDEDLHTHLSAYSHTVDAVAISLRTGELCTENSSIQKQSIDVGKKFMEVASSHDLDYAALKLIYLAIRHGYELEQNAVPQLDRQIADSIPMRKNAMRLAIELSIIDPERILDNFRRLVHRHKHKPAIQYFEQLLKFDSTKNGVG